MFDLSKIKTFDLKDLSGRTLQIESNHDKEENIIITMAMDVKTGDVFVLSYGCP